ncbi:MAG: hypothetical protein WAP35_04740 [Solirubrobacterales bacterium]
MPYLPGCARPTLDNDNISGPTNVTMWHKLFIFTGSGPYLGGYSICRNQEVSVSVGSPVSNAFFNWSRGPCGAGYYAAATCTLGFWSLTRDPEASTHAWANCGAAATSWLWTDNWHYFS